MTSGKPVLKESSASTNKGTSPICPRTQCKNETEINQIYGILPCEECQTKDSLTPELGARIPTYTMGKSHRIQEQRDKGAKDLIQPFVGNSINPDFAKAYPDKAKNYFTKKELESL